MCMAKIDGAALYTAEPNGIAIYPAEPDGTAMCVTELDGTAADSVKLSVPIYKKLAVWTQYQISKAKKFDWH